jgi:GNAT superfamily N-acetyltransferase
MVEIKRIEPTRSNLKRFTQFQIDLYKGNEYYVPPLLTDDIDTLTPSKNPSFDYCEAVCFMAYRDGKAVGRIAGIINNKVNEKEGVNTVRFGFIDFIDDQEVSAALLNAVEQWGKEKGMTRILGPMGFTDLDHEGMLVEGFDQLSTMATIYNYPYYSKHMEALGFTPDARWVEYKIDIPTEMPERHKRIADMVRQRLGMKVKKFTSRKEIKEQYGQAIFDLFNEAYDSLYGYSPLNDRQIEKYIKDYLGLLNLDLVTLIVDKDDQLVGVGVSMPSMSRALQKSKGRLFPFGWIHLLKGLKGKNDRVDLLMVAVKPQYQNKGVNALLFDDLIPQYIKYGFKQAESNPELALNDKVQSQWQNFPNTQHRQRVAFVKNI